MSEKGGVRPAPRAAAAMSPRPLPSIGITAWSWLNAAGRGVVMGGTRLGEPSLDSQAPWARPGLAPHPAGLGLPGHWGRVHEPLGHLPGSVLRHESRCATLLVRALEPLAPALEAARARYGRARVGVVLGSSTGGIDSTEVALAHRRAHGAMPAEYVFEEAHVYHALVRVVASLYELDGPGYVVSTACSSSGKALASAQRLLASGEADAVLTGGVDALAELTLRGFGGLGILSPEPSRPFDATRRGINIGEGAALLLLERDAKSPYRLLGAGESGDAYHLTAPHPEGLGARLAIERALTVSGLSADEVDYVNAHGTGTEQNDETEARALSVTLGPAVRYSSTKDRTGHQLGAAGATEAVFCLEALRLGVLPPNHRPEQGDERLPAQPYDGAALPRQPRTALSTSFAFGGSNVCVALGRRAEEASRAAAEEQALRVFVLGAAVVAPGRPELERELCPTCAPATARPALSARARGRASPLTALLAELYARLRGDQAPRFDEQEVGLVTASAYGEIATTLELLDQLGVEPTLSPARFQASVHNTAAGLLSIATGNRSFGTALAAGDATLAMALLEARAWLRCHGGSLLVLAADEAGSKRLLRGDTFPPLGLGLLLRAAETPPPGALAELGSLSPAPHEPTPDAPEELRRAPAAWGVALLRVLSRRESSAAVRVGYRWQVALNPAS